MLTHTRYYYCYYCNCACNNCTVLLINTDLLYVQQYEMVAINIIMLTTVSLLMDLRFPFVLAVELFSLGSYTILLFARGSKKDYADVVG
jgi:hypothetical protein